MGRWREARGQATSEYVALVALVAVVLALAAGLTVGGLGGQLLAGMQRALCQLTGTACEPPRPSADELAPCPVERTASSESLEGAFEVIRLGNGASLATVRGSDGRVTVTLANETSAGGEAAIGAKLAIGGRHGAELAGGMEASSASSRSWTLSSVAAARAFVDRYGSKATLGGKAVDLVRSGCSILCDAIGWRPHAELPPPDEVYFGRGTAATLTASLGSAGIDASNRSLLGARLRRDGSSTWYSELGASTGAALSLGAASLGAGSRTQTAVAYTLDARQRPIELAFHSVARNDAHGAAGAQRGRVVAALGAGDARVTEVDATLDLHDPRNRVAAAALATALHDPLAIATLHRRAEAVLGRIRRTGVIDRRTYALTGSAVELGAQLALGAQLGGAFARAHEGMRLLSAETRLPGLPFLPRDDCRLG
jgi:hypothetical protein